jgi:hypothetical protein
MLLVNVNLIVDNAQCNFGVERLGMILEKKNQSITKHLLYFRLEELITTPLSISEELVTTPLSVSEKLLVTSLICIWKG